MCQRSSGTRTRPGEYGILLHRLSSISVTKHIGFGILAVRNTRYVLSAGDRVTGRAKRGYKKKTQLVMTASFVLYQCRVLLFRIPSLYLPQLVEPVCFPRSSAFRSSI